MARPEDYAVLVQQLAPEWGGGYVARVPDLPGCMSDGETPQEAFANAIDAIGCWIEAAQDMGHTVPDPTPVEPEPMLKYA